MTDTSSAKYSLYHAINSHHFKIMFTTCGSSCATYTVMFAYKCKNHAMRYQE